MGPRTKLRHSRLKRSLVRRNIEVIHFADALKRMTQTSRQQDQKFQSNFGADPEKCGGRSCQMQLRGLIMSEQKRCQCQRTGDGHRTHGDALSPCCGRNGKPTQKCVLGCSCSPVMLIVKALASAAWRVRGDSRHDGGFEVGWD